MLSQRSNGVSSIISSIILGGSEVISASETRSILLASIEAHPTKRKKIQKRGIFIAFQKLSFQSLIVPNTSAGDSPEPAE